MTGDLRELRGVGEKTEKLLGKVGVFTQEDLLQYYPRAYLTYEEPIGISDLKEGVTCSLRGSFTGRPAIAASAKGKITTAQLRDETGVIRTVWYNAPYILSVIRQGGIFILRGKAVRKGNGMCFEHPEVYTPAAYQKLMEGLYPVYALTHGLSGKTVAKLTAQLFSEDAPRPELTDEYLPEDLVRRFGLADRRSALYRTHFPVDRQDLIPARERLVFDEFLQFILAVQLVRQRTETTRNAYPMKPVWDTNNLIDALPYRLTGAQMQTWQEVERDLNAHSRMSRLIQGDVGCGKTIIAFLAVLQCVKNGYQAALMVPTEVLAAQHYESFVKLAADHGLADCHPVLLTGSVRAARKKEIWRQIRTGEVNVVIGTHALIQDSVQWKSLGLAIIDEQHRFGVKQRQALCSMGEPPHLLVMSATPIPRTLALILYGDLDISVIDEMPGGRLPVKNCVVGPEYRPKAYAFLKKQLSAGHQAYVICPMVESSEGLDAENVHDYAQILRKELGPDTAIGILHGKLRPSEKNEVMGAFVRGEIRLLVSTTVVEVGVNVPAATVMMVENAERFGLAQLHQLRGRVGRGNEQAYCIFIQGSGGDEQKERLEIMSRSNDGFYIAGEDLRLRGPGDFFGVRQGGDLLFRIADIYHDSAVLAKANRAAAEILQEDPQLSLPGHRPLADRIGRFLSEDQENFEL